MRTERRFAASDPAPAKGLAHAPDPTTPGVVTVYDPRSEGTSLASQWLTLDEELLRDLADWR